MQEFCGLIGHAASHYSQQSDHCIFFSKSTCIIFCEQCEIEIHDSCVADERNTLFEFRRLFFPKLPPAKGEFTLLGGLLEGGCFPNQLLEHSLALLFANDFMRETIHRIHVAGECFERRFNKRPFPKLLMSLGKVLADLQARRSARDSIVSFYFDVISKDKRFGSYAISNFSVRL